MKRYDASGGIPTLDMALSEFMNSDDLKRLAALTKEKLPTRKADLAAVIKRHLDGDRLRTVWQCLDGLQRAAVAEVVHSSSTEFRTDHFHAKYGRSPNWGTTDKYGYHRSPSALGFFFYGNGVMPVDLKARLKAFVPRPAEAKVKTLVPHLLVMQRDFAGVVEQLRHVLADDAYHGNAEAVLCFGQGAQLILPVHPSGQSKAKVAEAHPGISRFTPIGVPVCQAEHRFEMRGRDLSDERYIWSAPNDERGQSVCLGCPIAKVCMGYGERRHIRVYRHDFPQINWDQPQYLSRNRARYAKRTGVERAIKRLKVDLGGEHLTHRYAARVQAHLDRKLLTLHLLLKAGAAP